MTHLRCSGPMLHHSMERKRVSDLGRLHGGNSKDKNNEGTWQTLAQQQITLFSCWVVIVYSFGNFKKFCPTLNFDLNEMNN